ncbi:MAG TPA: FG-GAP-like repeat-containing protein, partial [Verrucomicrobiota bacterium]|nr:FG-GAP-like repeat-containing protein [Verrucomicrobiota bacterium]HNU50562.1 FG-GAP-like repeat-containing protein [Verrucomicrobiota bacterium]
AATADKRVDPIDDTLVEGPETVVLTLLAGAGYTESPNTATVTIADNDPAEQLVELLWQYRANDAGIGRLHAWLMGPTGKAGDKSYGEVAKVGGWRVVAKGDFTGDGIDDLVWQHATGQVAIWPTDGSSILQNEAEFISLNNPDWQVVGAGDFDGDGKTDLLLEHRANFLHIWLMDGMQPKPGGGVGLGQWTMPAWRVAGVADMTGDGKPDIVWQHWGGWVHVWRMDGTKVVWKPDGKSLEGCGLNIVMEPPWDLVTVGDYTGDGHADLVFQHRLDGKVAVQPLKVSSGCPVADDADRVFCPPLKPQWRVAGPLPYRDELRVISLRDLLDFGTCRVGATKLQYLRIHNDSLPELRITKVECPEGFSCDWTGAIASGAFVDVPITFVPEESGDYVGTVTFICPGATGKAFINVRGRGADLTCPKVDFNDDGVEDLLWQHVSGDLNAWLMGGPCKVGDLPLPDAGDLRDWLLVGTRDFTGDCRPDLVWQHPAGPVRITPWDGSALRRDQERTVFLPDRSWQVVGLADFDGDGGTDILLQHTAGWLHIWLMDGLEMRGTGKGLNQWPLPGWRIAGVADMTGDSKPDIVWQHSTGLIHVWQLNGTDLVFTGTPARIKGYGLQRSPIYGWDLVGLLDCTGDGQADLSLRNRFDGRMALWPLTLVNAQAQPVVTGQMDCGSLPSRYWRIAGPLGYQTTIGAGVGLLSDEEGLDLDSNLIDFLDPGLE